MADLEIQNGGVRYACSLLLKTFILHAHVSNYPFDLTMHIFRKSIIVGFMGELYKIHE